MGKFLSKLKVFGKREIRILMLGLDGSGKTTVLYKLKLDQPVTAIPTVGFNVETVSFKDVKFCIWDVGGQDKIRPLWRHYFTGTQGLIFVIDSSDRERIDEAVRELFKIVKDRTLNDIPILIYANKQDMPNALRPQEIHRRLELYHDCAPLDKREWHVQPSIATSGEGIDEGLTWLMVKV